MASFNIEADSDVRHAGWLKKKNPTGPITTWKPRWFVITENQLDAELKYYTSDKMEECKGQVNLMEILEINGNISEGKSKAIDSDLRFDIIMGKRTYELLAPSTEEKAAWIKALGRVSDATVVDVDSGIEYEKEGYLVKQSGGNTTSKHWNKRFFRLRNDGDAQSLQYYKDATSSSPQGTIPLADVTAVRAVVEETAGSAGGGTEAPALEVRFEVKTFARTFVFGEAPGTGGLGAKGLSKKVWVKKLREACGLPDYDEGPCGGRLVLVPAIETAAVGIVLGNAAAGGGGGGGGEADTAADSQDAGSRKGAMVVEVKAGSAAEDCGVLPLDRVHRINGVDVPLALGHKHVRERLKAAARPLNLVVERRVTAATAAAPPAAAASDL